MKKNSIKGIDEEYFYEKLNNGLEVYLMPDSKSKIFRISYSVKYGSAYNGFKTANQKNYTYLPNGAAHFLEHLMFKEKDGKDANEKFAKYGASSNAFTSIKETRYYVVGSKNFKENLNILLSFVNNPYFTNDNVEKERGIIIEEINRDNDNPYRDLNVKSRENLYYYNRYKESVIGTIKEVKSITLKDIENVYNTFYNPHNMFIVITGKFKKEEALKIIKNNKSFNSLTKYQKVSLKKYQEPLNVKKSYEEIYKNIKVPKATIKLKLSLNDFKKIFKPKLSFCFSLIIDAKFGSTSSLNEMLINKGLIIGSLYPSFAFEEENIVLTITFESNNPKKVIPIMKKELSKMDITKEELARKKRCLLSSMILYFDNISNKSNALTGDVINYGKVINNYYQIINKLSVKEINSITKKIKINKNISIMVINPIKKSTK